MVDEQAGLVTFSNRSCIASVPASERAIRGRRVDLLLGDEMAYVPDDLWLGAALPTVAARPDARVVMASSAGPASGFFYDHAVRGERGDPHVVTFRWTLDDPTWLTPAAVEAFRVSMSEVCFAAEMEGVFATGGDFLFTRRSLEPVLADYALTDLEQLRGPARLGAGVDWGHTVDRTVATVVGRFAGTDPPVFDVVAQRPWPEAYPPLRSAEEVAASPGHFEYVVSEGNGLGGPASDHLFEMLTRRPPEAGGGRKQRALVVEEGAFPHPAAPAPALGGRSPLAPDAEGPRGGRRRARVADHGVHNLALQVLRTRGAARPAPTSASTSRARPTARSASATTRSRAWPPSASRCRWAT